jgi:hypothetical protein
MKRLTILAAALALAAPVFAADEGAMFAKHWQTSKEFTLAVAEAMPAADYNFKPNDEEMSFGKVMAHIAMANNNRAFATVSGSKAPDAGEDRGGVRRSQGRRIRQGEHHTIPARLVRLLHQSVRSRRSITPEKLDAMFGPAMSGARTVVGLLHAHGASSRTGGSLLADQGYQTAGLPLLRRVRSNSKRPAASS